MYKVKERQRHGILLYNGKTYPYDMCFGSKEEAEYVLKRKNKRGGNKSCSYCEKMTIEYSPTLKARVATCNQKRCYFKRKEGVISG